MSANVRNRDAAALAIASGRSITDTAATCGVNERTLRRWQDDPAFLERVDSLRAEFVTTALARLSATMTAAADELKALVACADPNVRLRACRAVIELTAKLVETVELKRQVADLEQRIVEMSK